MSEQNEVNPLKQRLSKDQFDASVKFYEADHALTPEDRVEIASDLQRLLFNTSIVGYTSGMLGFLAPTAYNKFVRHRSMPANAIRPWIYKPMLSFFLGLVTLTIVHPPVTKVYFNKIKGQLQDSPGKLRQLNAWNSFDYHQAGLFYVYYRGSAKDPSLILEDPRSYRGETLPPVRYRPTHDEQIRQKQGQLTQWDQLRVNNGFEPAPEKDNDLFATDDIFKPQEDENKDSFGYIDTDKYNYQQSQQNQSKSKWDDIRNAK